MPIGKYINEQWLSANGQRRYPLADDAGGVDTTGSFAIPNEFILELDLPIHAGLDVDPGRFFLYSLAAYDSGFLITVAYQPAAGDPVPVASAIIPRATHTRYAVYNMGGVSPFDDTAGKVVIGQFGEVDRQPAGQFFFEFLQGRLDPDAIRPIIRGVSSLRVRNGTEESVPVVGDAVLVAGTNFRITVDGQEIRLDAISGAGLTEECLCEDGSPSVPITSINGVPGSSDGAFNLVGSECIEFQALTNGLRAVDVCAQPCCGFAELERITEALERVNAEAVTTQAFVNRLQTAVDTFNLTVLGARLGDRPCVTCG